MEFVQGLDLFEWCNIKKPKKNQEQQLEKAQNTNGGISDGSLQNGVNNSAQEVKNTLLPPRRDLSYRCFSF